MTASECFQSDRNAAVTDLAEGMNRDLVLSHVDPLGVSSILDLGCGRGHDLRLLAERIPAARRLVGIDSAAHDLGISREKSSGDSRFEFVEHDLDQGLPCGDAEFDVVFSKNLLETVCDKDALLRDVHRVLTSGGQVVFAHHDWDSQMIDVDDKELARQIVHAFGDWKQEWMVDCDSWMGHRLLGVFRRSGLFDGDLLAHLHRNGVRAGEIRPRTNPRLRRTRPAWLHYRGRISPVYRAGRGSRRTERVPLRDHDVRVRGAEEKAMILPDCFHGDFKKNPPDFGKEQLWVVRERRSPP